MFSFSECCLGTLNVVVFPHCVGKFECTVCLVVWAVNFKSLVNVNCFRSVIMNSQIHHIYTAMVVVSNQCDTIVDCLHHYGTGHKVRFLWTTGFTRRLLQ